MYKLLIAPLVAFLSRLRFPYLFLVTAALFLLDFVIPDAIPFADELLLALGAALFGSWKKRKQPGEVHNR
jgi:thiol:disulfide interchange protein